MAKEKDIFEGFDLFDPVAKLRTPDPDKQEKVSDTPIEVIKTKEQLEKEAQTAFDENLEKQSIESKDKKTEVKDTPAKVAVKEDTSIPAKEESVTEPVEETKEFSFKPFIEHLAKQGIIEVDDEELSKVTDDEEGLEGVVGKTISSNIQKGIESYKEQFPEDVNELLKFVELGGNPKDFYDVYYGGASFENMKVNSEDSQRFVVRQGLKLAGFDDTEVEEELKNYEDLGKLEARAITNLRKLQVHEKEQKANLLKIQEQNKVQEQNNIKAYWDNLKSELDKKDQVQGFKLAPKEKEKLWEFISVPDKRSGKTKLQVHNETNKDSQYLYAYLAMHNWDISKLEKEATTKATSSLRATLGKFTDSRQKISGARDNQREEQEVDPFSGFDKLKLK